MDTQPDTTLPPVILYSHERCSACRVMKDFLTRDLQVPFELRDVSSDPAAVAAFLEMGGRLPPLLVIGDDIVEGFDPEAIIAAVEAHTQGKAPGSSRGGPTRP